MESSIHSDHDEVLQRPLLELGGSKASDHAMSLRATLDSKNFKLFTRNKDRMKSEVIGMCIFLGVMILFGWSIDQSKTIKTLGAAPMALSIRSNTTLVTTCDQSNYNPENPCFVYFGNDNSEPDGCTSELSDFMKNDVTFCKYAADPTQQYDIYMTTNVVVPICECALPVNFSNATWADSSGAAAALAFDEALTGQYTLYGPDLSISQSDLTSNIVRYADTEDVPSFYTQVIPFQVAIDSAFIGKELDVHLSYFPQEPYTQVNVSQVTFIPLYCVLLLGYAFLSITTEICKESLEDLRHGLFMIGLDPYVYWLGWIRMMIYRVLFTLIPLIIVLKVMILTETNLFLLILTLVIYSLWFIMFCLICGLVGVNPDAVNIFLVLIPSIMASVTYAYLPYLSNSDYEMVIPAWGTSCLSFTCPPFAAAMFFTIALMYEGNGNVFDFSSVTDDTAFLVTGFEMIVALVVALIVTALLVVYLIGKSTGIAPTTSLKKEELETIDETTYTSMSPPSCDDIESASKNVAVSVKMLRKRFTKTDGNQIQAVDGLTVDFYENQITSFLGHNGAGKSTTISILTGLFAADSGDATINGFSVVNEMAKIRPLLGVCPQKNVLWDLLSVTDHIKLFSRIRGVPDRVAKDNIKVLLKEIGLEDKADTWAKDLSGGQKRKLQVACALIGDPSVIFLDEPTAGMDSNARRDLWDLLLRKRKGKCIILCTHAMDEADILGDRVAVVSAGKIQAYDTPTALKTQYSKGNCLDISVKSNADRRSILNLIEINGGNGVDIDLSALSYNSEEKKLMREEILNQTSSGDLRLVIPHVDGNDFSSVLEALESECNKGRESSIENFGVHGTSLEDVFWELGQKADESGGYNAPEFKLPKSLKLEPPSTWNMMKLLVIRHFNDFTRKILQQFSKSLFILIYIGLGLFFLTWNPSFQSETATDSLDLTANAFNNVEGYTVPWDGNNQPYGTMMTQMQDYAKSSPSLPTPINASHVSPCLSAWLAHSVDAGLCPASTGPSPDPSSKNQPQDASAQYVGAYEFNPVFDQSSAFSYTVYQNQSVNYAMFGLLSFANNGILLSSPSEYVVNFSFYQWVEVLTDQQVFLNNVIVNFILGQMGGLLFCIAINYLGAKAAMKVVEDVQLNVKQMQVLMGVSLREYFLAQIFWDFLNFFAILFIPLVVTYSLDSRVASLSLIVLLALYVFCTSPLIYTCSKLFQEPGPAYSGLSFIGMVSFIACSVVYLTYAGIQLGQGSTTTDGDWLYYLFLLHPIFALQQGLVAITWGKTFDYSPLLMECPDNLDYGWTFQTAAWPCIYLFLEGMILSALYLWMEYSSSGGTESPFNKFIAKSYQYCCRCVGIDHFYKSVDSAANESEEQAGVQADYFDSLTQKEIEDDDVEDERREIVEYIGDHEKSLKMNIRNRIAGDSDWSSYAVVANELRKEYPASGKQRYEGTVAVKDFSLRIRNRETLSLLGSNGAGKTSVMNILLRQLHATSGRVYIQGEPLEALSEKTARSMSYCPQQNALFDVLTCRETMEFYCAVRGVDPLVIEKYANEWLQCCDLMKHAATLCRDLSGGNKRKLSLAIALIGNPSFIVLDEPGAGVDPAARRKLHSLINYVKRSGATIVLTTHHMDEAASLGDRVGIMVKGYLCCLGSVQHLISKYGKGYLLTACMNKGFSFLEDLLPAVREVCPDAKISMSSGTHYCVVLLGNGKGFSIARLYRVLQDLTQKDHKIDYFSVGQSRLEDVFLQFTERLLKGKDDVEI